MRQEEDEDYKGPKEDCVEECKLFPALAYYVFLGSGVVAHEETMELPVP